MSKRNSDSSYDGKPEEAKYGVVVKPKDMKQMQSSGDSAKAGRGGQRAREALDKAVAKVHDPTKGKKQHG